MGYSCASKAAFRLDAIAAYCVANSGSQNVWTDAKGTRYFFEQGREQGDGAITGSVQRFVGETLCRKCGSIRIDPDGIGFKGPAMLKKVPAYMVSVDGFPTGWPSSLGEPTDATLWAYLLKVAKGYEAGGVNAHVSKGMGFVPYPTKANVVRLNDGVLVVAWAAGVFQIWDTSAVA